MASLVPVQTEADLESLAGLASAIWNEYFPDIIGQAQVDYMVDKFQSAAAMRAQMAEEGYEYYFVVEHGSTAGYIGIVPRTDRQVMQISKFYLTRDWRGRGLAGGIVDGIAGLAAARGLKRLYLTVNKYNESAIRAYERIGFSRTGSLETDIGGGFIMDDFEMEKAIA